MMADATTGIARDEYLVQRYEDLAGRAELRARGIYER